MRALVALQLVALVVAAVAVAARFPVWALVDEQAHYDYVQTLAEDGRFPDVRRDLVHEEVLAIGDGTFPGPPSESASERGLAGRSYEAFQPPLWYLVAVPAFAVGGGHDTKVRVLRGLGVVLLLCAAALTWSLARRVVPEDPLPAFSVGLTVLLWPGVVVRAVTVSNAALELVAGAALSLALWQAWERRDSWWLPAAGALLGLALLTKLTLLAFAPSLLVLVFAYVRERRLRQAGVALAAPALLLAPWIAGNLDRYGELTGSAAGRAVLEPSVNPDGRDYGLNDLGDAHRTLLNGVLPEEWWVEFLSAAKRRARDVFMAVVLLVPLVLALRLPGAEARRALAVLVLPLVAGIALMWISLLAENWLAFQPRYLYATLPGFAAFAALGLARVLRRRWTLIASAALTVLLLAVWARMATVTPATL